VRRTSSQACAASVSASAQWTLKIASIALVIDALLVTANLRDFSLVPGLRCENWLQQ
jgi:predicted nucleic acid-binding protein